MSKLSLGGNDSGAHAPPSYFNPLTGGFGSEVKYTQRLDIGKRQCHWTPRGLTLRMIYDGKTEGYKRKRAAPGIPGWVWVKV